MLMMLNSYVVFKITNEHAQYALLQLEICIENFSTGWYKASYSWTQQRQGLCLLFLRVLSQHWTNMAILPSEPIRNLGAITDKHLHIQEHLYQM